MPSWLVCYLVLAWELALAHHPSHIRAASLPLLLLFLIALTMMGLHPQQHRNHHVPACLAPQGITECLGLEGTLKITWFQPLATGRDATRWIRLPRALSTPRDGASAASSWCHTGLRPLCDQKSGARGSSSILYLRCLLSTSPCLPALQVMVTLPWCS